MAAPVRIALFDMNGTLLDPSGIGAPVGLGAEASTEALGLAIQQSMAETLAGGYRPFSEYLAASLARLVELDGRPADGLDEALERAGRMPPFPDAAPALERLRAAGVDAGVLTNSATDVAEGALAAAGLRHRLSVVVGTDAVEAYKPDPRVYRRGAEAAGVDLGEACLVTAHWFDALGAKRAGMQTAWITRKEHVLLRTVPEPDIRADSLEDAAARLGDRRGAR